METFKFKQMSPKSIRVVKKLFLHYEILTFDPNMELLKHFGANGIIKGK